MEFVGTMESELDDLIRDSYQDLVAVEPIAKYKNVRMAYLKGDVARQRQRPGAQTK